MAKIVLVFESRYGQTEKIADYIVASACREGHDVRALRTNLVTQGILDGAEAFIVVAPVYFGSHPGEIRHFLRRHASALARRPLAFVSVSNSAGHPGVNARGNASHMAYRTVDDAGLSPDVVVTTAGALAYPRYGFFVRQMMRLIAWSTGGPTDVRKVHELTDWEQLERDLAPFFRRLNIARRAATTAAPADAPAPA